MAAVTWRLTSERLPPISLKPSSRPYELSCSAVCGLEHGRGDRLGQARAVESDAQVLTRVLSARVLAPGRAQLRTPGEYPELRCPFAVPVIVRAESRFYLDREGAIGRASCREKVCPTG